MNEHKCFQLRNGEGTSTHKIRQLSQWVMDGSYLDYVDTVEKMPLVLRKIASAEIVFDEPIINGKIMYIDAHANAVTNIPLEMFHQFDGKPFEAVCGSANQLIITKYHDYINHYESEVFLTQNTLGYIEITFYEGNVAFLCNLQVGDDIEIKFIK